MEYRIAKVFMNGRSQAVRLPKEFRFSSDEVYISKQGSNVIISEEKPSWDEFFDLKSAFSDEFLRDRLDSRPQERDFD